MAEGNNIFPLAVLVISDVVDEDMYGHKVTNINSMQMAFKTAFAENIRKKEIQISQSCLHCVKNI
jgi:hypothetical protein